MYKTLTGRADISPYCQVEIIFLQTTRMSGYFSSLKGLDDIFPDCQVELIFFKIVRVS